jgi:hypothetical protein
MGGGTGHELPEAREWQDVSEQAVRAPGEHEFAIVVENVEGVNEEAAQDSILYVFGCHISGVGWCPEGDERSQFVSDTPSNEHFSPLQR